MTDKVITCIIKIAHIYKNTQLSENNLYAIRKARLINMNFVLSLQNVRINQDASGTTGTTTVITRSNEARFFDLQKNALSAWFFSVTVPTLLVFRSVRLFSRLLVNTITSNLFSFDDAARNFFTTFSCQRLGFNRFDYVDSSLFLVEPIMLCQQASLFSIRLQIEGNCTVPYFDRCKIQPSNIGVNFKK